MANFLLRPESEFFFIPILKFSSFYEVKIQWSNGQSARFRRQCSGFESGYYDQLLRVTFLVSLSLYRQYNEIVIHRELCAKKIHLLYVSNLEYNPSQLEFYSKLVTQSWPNLLEIVLVLAHFIFSLKIQLGSVWKIGKFYGSRALEH